MPNPTINWPAISHLKKAAKAAAEIYPQLTHKQRLDVLAAEVFGVRHYHELEVRYQSLVSKHVHEIEPGLHHCRFCSFTFAGNNASDARTHLDRHKAFEEARIELGFAPLPYKQRELIKRAGYQAMQSEDGAEQRLGALALLLAHFDRSLESVIEGGAWPKHPEFTRYVPAVLASTDLLPEPLKERLVKEFGSVPEVMKQGNTYWPPSYSRLAPDPIAGEASRALRKVLLDVFLQDPAEERRDLSSREQSEPASNMA